MRILVVHREECVQAALRLMLRCAGFDVIGAASGSVAMQITLRNPPDIALVDLQAATASGMSAFTALRRRWSKLPVVAIVPAGKAAEAIPMVGVSGVLSPPFSQSQLLAVIRDTVASTRPRGVPAPPAVAVAQRAAPVSVTAQVVPLKAL